jgi:hypothetical protein
MHLPIKSGIKEAMDPLTSPPSPYSIHVGIEVNCWTNMWMDAGLTIVFSPESAGRGKIWGSRQDMEGCGADMGCNMDPTMG